MKNIKHLTLLGIVTCGLFASQGFTSQYRADTLETLTCGGVSTLLGAGIGLGISHFKLIPDAIAKNNAQLAKQYGGRTRTDVAFVGILAIVGIVISLALYQGVQMMLHRRKSASLLKLNKSNPLTPTITPTLNTL